jgi:hypothetical protein
VAATWNTSITAADRQAPLARPALEMTAYLAPEAIPRSFFAVLEENSAARRKRVASSYWWTGRTGEAIALDERVAADTERLLGPEHPDTLAVRSIDAQRGHQLASNPGKAARAGADSSEPSRPCACLLPVSGVHQYRVRFRFRWMNRYVWQPRQRSKAALSNAAASASAVKTTPTAVTPKA